MANRKWNSDKILSISAIAISFMTLVIFVYQTNLLRKQNYISILPYLDLGTTQSTVDHTFELNLRNHGIGPAIIESVQLELEGRRYDISDYDYEVFAVFRSLVPTLDSVVAISSSTLDRGMAIPANTTYNVFGVREAVADFRIVTGVLDSLLAQGLRYEIVYRSIQGERWMIHNDTDGPEKLD